MPQPSCSTHQAAATHRCDGCERFLCEECIDVGHRLLFCVHCRERALPLEEEASANALELSRERARQAPYSLKDALVYPFRGLGAFVFWGTVVFFGGLNLVEAVFPPAWLITLVLRLLILIMAPGLSLAIVRNTAQGNNELPDWPDWGELGERMSELFAMLVLGFMALVPAIFLIQMARCEVGLIMAEPGCVLLMGLGLLLGMFLWVPACGAVATFGNTWLSIRWDLHVRALGKIWRDSARIAFGVAGVYLAGAVVGWLLSWLPLVGGLAVLVTNVYAWFVGMHLIGLLMRQHEPELEPIYFR